jgi:hypothetical protein
MNDTSCIQEGRCMTDASRQAGVRYSLGTFFGVILMVGAGCALLFAIPIPVRVPLIASAVILLPAALTAGTVYSRGECRAFCIGALIPMGLQLYTVGWVIIFVFIDGPSPFSSTNWSRLCEGVDTKLRIYTATIWGLAVIAGSTVVVIRWWALKNRVD